MNTSPTYRALVVDDEAAVRQLITRALSRVGFVCELATDGQDALAMVRANQYDIVVTDLKMPGIHGHGLALQILEMSRRPGILVATGVAEPRIASDLRSRGVEDIFFKPVDIERLGIRAREIAEQRIETLREVYQGVGNRVGAWQEVHIDEHAASVANHAPVSSCNTELQESSGEEWKSSVELPVDYGIKQEHASESSDDPCRPRDILSPTQSNNRLPADTKSIETSVAQISEILPPAPQQYDGFSNISDNTFSAKDLVVAIESNPKLALEVMQLTNRVMYRSHQEILDFELSVAAGKKSFLIWLSAAFALGVLWGWLFGWLQATHWFSGLKI